MKKGLFVLLLFLYGCTWWQAWYVAQEVVEHYPPDNPLENKIVEPFIEDQLGLEPDSIDISFWNDDEDKGWVKNTSK